MTIFSNVHCTVVNRVKKVKITFMTFSLIMADLGMGKPMVMIFLMNSIKIIGYSFFAKLNEFTA